MSRARMPKLGEALRAAREARGWSIRGLAERVGISPTTITQAEAGLPPNTPNLIAIAAALGVTVGSLLGEDTSAVAALERALPGWSELQPDQQARIQGMVSDLAGVPPRRRELQRVADGEEAYEPLDLDDLSEDERDVVMAVSRASRPIVAAAFRAHHARQHPGEVGLGRPIIDHVTPRTTRPRPAG